MIAFCFLSSGSFCAEKAKEKTKLLNDYKTKLLDTKGGEDEDTKVVVSLSDEYKPGDKKRCKAVFKAEDEGGVGIRFSKPSNWKDYNILRVEMFNPTEEPMSISVMIADEESKAKWAYNNHFTKGQTLKPGDNVIEIDIEGLTAHRERAMDLSKIMHLIFYYGIPKTDVIVYIGDIKLVATE